MILSSLPVRSVAGARPARSRGFLSRFVLRLCAVLALSGATLLVAGCGQKGPLFRPQALIVSHLPESRA
ncbi:LPS translocon maturation chaperone LptM [Amphibiibacter pelophylacis]|uniref:Lipoprotein n=1 Tax=Amphibiibacter pelophylacis TaxID=1799477 RepID=A0ACC6P1I2_9BURK